LERNFINSLNVKEKEDLANRLNSAGYKTSPNIDELSSALDVFIKDKNIRLVSISQIWTELSNFGYSLGDRLLNLSTPQLYGSDVEELQELLSRLGFYSGTHTSIYSEDLERAVEKFQENRGLAVDGNVGLNTVEELRSMQRPGERLSLNNAINVMGSRNIFLNKQNNSVCFYIPHVENYKVRTGLYESIRQSSIKNNINPIFASDVNKEIDIEYLINFANQIQPSFFIVIRDAEIDEINFFKGKYSESVMGKVLAKNLAETLSMKLRGSSSEVLTKTKPATIIININNIFGNYYQKIDSEKICYSIVSSIKEIGTSLP